MGSEVSTESGKHNVSRPVMRSNSLKDVNISDENINKLSPDTQKVGKPVRRSATFSGLTGARPQITRRAKKKTQQTTDNNREVYIAEDVCVDVTHGITIDFNPEKRRSDIDNNDEDLFIPTKKNYGSIESSNSPTETTSLTSTEVPNDKEKKVADEHISPIFEQRSLDQNSTVLETNLTTCRSSSSDKGSPCRLRRSGGSLEKVSLCRYKKRSNDETNNAIVTTNEDIVDDMEYKVKTTNVIRLKTSEKRKKVSRSKSLTCSNERMSVMEQRYNSAVEDEDKAIETADKSLEASGRRTSDSHLLREHVKRSEQFSAMLKQIENRTPKRQQLSPYALGAIAGRMSPQSPPPRSKHLRQNDFFDSWIKDQSERINNLAEAVRGDELKVNELRSSFRVRELQTNRWVMLPPKPKSDKLPRRRQYYSKITNYISSDTEDELDTKPFSEVNYGNTKSRQHDGAILTKQLSDTFLLLDNSFKNSKKDFHRHERSSEDHRKVATFIISD